MSFAIKTPLCNKNWPFGWEVTGTWEMTAFMKTVPTDGTPLPPPPPPPPPSWNVLCLLFEDDGSGAVAGITNQYADNMDAAAGTWHATFSLFNLNVGSNYFMMAKLIKTQSGVSTTVATANVFNIVPTNP